LLNLIVSGEVDIEIKQQMVCHQQKKKKKEKKENYPQFLTDSTFVAPCK
jgi:hypothetical protein